jgi:hypothetical protein
MNKNEKTNLSAVFENRKFQPVNAALHLCNSHKDSFSSLTRLLHIFSSAALDLLESHPILFHFDEECFIYFVLTDRNTIARV